MMLRLWVEQGAVWPEGFTLGDTQVEESGPADNLALVERIRWRVPRIHRKPEQEMEGIYQNDRYDRREIRDMS